MRRLAAFAFIVLTLGSALPQKRSIPFTLSALDGQTVNLARYRGQIVVLSFGATWCPPCREELPVLQKVADRYAGRPVAFFWISIDDPDVSNEQLRQFVSRLGVRLPVLRDPEARILQEFKTDGVPALLILDRNGEPIGAPHVGFSDPDNYASELTRTLDALLKP
jgi:thiol-disulfide isomerase/thioredoxin